MLVVLVAVNLSSRQLEGQATQGKLRGYYGSGNKVKKRAPPVWIFKIKEILVVYFGSFSTVEAKVIVMKYIYQMVEFRVFVPQY